MKISNKLAAIAMAVVGISLFASSQAHADTVCNGTISGTHTNVIVNNSATVCTLSNATVQGNVSVSNGGRLTMSGTTQVLGDIQATSAGVMQLNSGTVLGAVSLSNSSNLTVGSAAVLNSLTTFSSGTLTLRGRVGTVNAISGGSISITGATIAAGVYVSSGLAGMTICGADITGGISMTGTNGGLSIGIGSTCAVNSIDGSIFVSNGTGAVRISNADMIAADVSVVEQSGNVILTNVPLSDLLIEKLTGSVTLTGIAPDSDTKILQVSGFVNLSASSLGSDMEIVTPGTVSLLSNNFGGEDINISTGTAGMTISNNINIGAVSISDRGNITFSNNNFGAANFSKNGAISLTGNTGASLDCVDNSPAPTGSNNNVVSKTGQCAGL
jgi:hypothetical protein